MCAHVSFRASVWDGCWNQSDEWLNSCTSRASKFCSPNKFKMWTHCSHTYSFYLFIQGLVAYLLEYVGKSVTFIFCRPVLNVWNCKNVFLGESAKERGLLIGYDHRASQGLSSKNFAIYTAQACLERGMKVYLYDKYVPTPLVVRVPRLISLHPLPGPLHGTPWTLATHFILCSVRSALFSMRAAFALW